MKLPPRRKLREAQKINACSLLEWWWWFSCLLQQLLFAVAVVIVVVVVVVVRCCCCCCRCCCCCCCRCCRCCCCCCFAYPQLPVTIFRESPVRKTGGSPGDGRFDWLVLLLSFFSALFCNYDFWSLEFQAIEASLGKFDIVQVGVSSENTFCRLTNRKNENGKLVFVKRNTIRTLVPPSVAWTSLKYLFTVLM